MSGWWAAVGVGALLAVVAVREVLRWRGGRWFGGMRSGSRPDDEES